MTLQEAWATGGLMDRLIAECQDAWVKSDAEEAARMIRRSMGSDRRHDPKAHERHAADIVATSILMRRLQKLSGTFGGES